MGSATTRTKLRKPQQTVLSSQLVFVRRHAVILGISAHHLSDVQVGAEVHMDNSPNDCSDNGVCFYDFISLRLHGISQAQRVCIWPLQSGDLPWNSHPDGSLANWIYSCLRSV